MTEIPHDLFLDTSYITDLVNNVFPEFENKFRNSSWIKNRPILCPTNKEGLEVNKLQLESFPIH